MVFDTRNQILAAALVIGGTSAAYKAQYQALFYLLVIVYGAFDWAQFVVYTLVYFVVLLAGVVIRGTNHSGRG